MTHNIDDFNRYRFTLRMAALLLIACVLALSVAIHTPRAKPRRVYSCGGFTILKDGNLRVYSYNCALDDLPSWSRFGAWLCAPEALHVNGAQSPPRSAQAVLRYVVRWVLARIAPALERESDGLYIDRRHCRFEYMYGGY